MNIRKNNYVQLALSILLSLLVGPTVSQAKSPDGPQSFCVAYPSSPFCASQSPACNMCHSGAPAFNAYGAALDLALHPTMPARVSGTPGRLPAESFAAMLPAALASIDALDSDGDGYTNLEEIMAGTLPGRADSFPKKRDICPPPVANPIYDTCNYDPVYAYQKVYIDFCGYRPSFDALEAFKQATESEQLIQIDLAIDTCLDSEFWTGQDGLLWRIAHAKIKPLKSIKTGEDNTGGIQLADYYPDYHLFVYTQTDDRDARDVLKANYFVGLEPGTEPISQRYVKLTEAESRSLWGQEVSEDRKAGLITSAWFLMFNTMFTAVPRTTAAQAYRAYLGLDIARNEGLSGYEIAGEPKDYDDKGVDEPGSTCFGCHTVLDPLSYPFSTYNGLGGAGIRYNPDRLTEQDTFSELVDRTDVEDMPETGYIFGRAVNDLLAWADVAANSEDFAKATVNDYWKQLIGEKPELTDQEYENLWRDFMDGNAHNYRVEKMLKALIHTEAYGVP